MLPARLAGAMSSQSFRLCIQNWPPWGSWHSGVGSKAWQVGVCGVVLSAGIQRAAGHCWACRLVRDPERLGFNHLKMPFLRQIKKFHMVCP